MKYEQMAITTTAFDAVFDRIFPEARATQVAKGFRFTEGPVWHPTEACLYFTDFRVSHIYRWDEATGCCLYREGSHRAVGLALDGDGRLIACESSAHRVAYTGPTDSLPLADTYEGSPYNSPNDVIVSMGGDVLFTDPYSTSMGAPRCQPCNGVYRATPGERARLLTDVLPRPNGLAFSPGEALLYVNDTSQQLIRAFDVADDGSLCGGRIFATLDTAFGAGAADGMKVDAAGRVYVTGPGGIWAFGPDGRQLGILRLPELVANFCFGGAEDEYLFATASASVYRVLVNTSP